MANWRPIESAPRDGTYVDLWVVGDDLPQDPLISRVVGCWRRSSSFVDPEQAEGWHVGVSALSRRYEATHWMPLPEPPR